MATPSVEQTQVEAEKASELPPLPPAKATTFRSILRLADAAQDRVDIGEAVKCLTRRMVCTQREWFPSAQANWAIPCGLQACVPRVPCRDIA